MHPSSSAVARRTRRSPRLAFALVILAAGTAASCTNPQSEAARAQKVLEIGDAVNATKNELLELRGTVDSLRIVVSKQDSTIARLANVTGVVVVK